MTLKDPSVTLEGAESALHGIRNTTHMFIYFFFLQKIIFLFHNNGVFFDEKNVSVQKVQLLRDWWVSL